MRRRPVDMDRPVRPSTKRPSRWNGAPVRRQLAQGNGPDRCRRAILPRKRTTALAKAEPVIVGGGPGRNSGPVTAAPPKGKTLYWKWIASASLGEGP